MELDGLWIPLVTPFDDRGEVDLGALARLTGDVLGAGATGVVVLATTGEPTSLDAGERDAVVGCVAAVCAERGAPLIVGAGTADTRTTLARHEALADVPGVVASLAVVPYYVRPSEAGIVAHLGLVAARSPVPVIVYNIPYRTGRGLGAAALHDLAATDGVVAVKQAVGGIDADTLAVLAAGDLAVLAGDDPFLFPLILLGARGGITASAHVATAEFAALVADGLAGRVGPGRRRAAALLPLVTALFAEPSPAVIKAALHAEGRLASPAVRMPLTPASAPALDAARAAYATDRAG